LMTKALFESVRWSCDGACGATLVDLGPQGRHADTRIDGRWT